MSEVQELKKVIRSFERVLVPFSKSDSQNVVDSLGLSDTVSHIADSVLDAVYGNDNEKTLNVRSIVSRLRVEVVMRGGNLHN